MNAVSELSLQFDRGTLRFLGGWPKPLLAQLPDLRWDPRSGVHRAPPWRYPEIRRALRDRDVCCDDRVLRSPTGRYGSWSALELRPYQEAAVCAWLGAAKRGIICLPTGSGKTRVALGAMAAHGASTLCLVPTRILMHQWREQLGLSYGGTIACWGDGERQIGPVTVMTFESAHRNVAQVGSQFSLVVIDEVHHFGNGARDEILELLAAPYRLGLSATLCHDPVVIARLTELVGPAVIDMSIADLAGRYLADFDIVEIPVALEADERQTYERDMATFRKVHRAYGRPAGPAWRDFVAAAQQSREGREALSAWRRARRLTAFTRGKAVVLAELLRRHRARRVLVFTSDNETAYAIAKRELIMPLTCDIRRDERDDALTSFRKGELGALVSARVLNEGIDVPDADVAIIVGGSHGEREHVQRVGRLLRPRAGKRAIVYELIASGTSEASQARRRRRALGHERAR